MVTSPSKSAVVGGVKRAVSSKKPSAALKRSAPRQSADGALETTVLEGYDVVSEAEAAYQKRGLKSVKEFAAVFSIDRASKILQANAKEDLDVHRLTYAGWLALTVLSYAKARALPTAKLASRVGTHPTTLTKTVDNLQRLGFVRRISKDGDRRVVVVELTPEGDAVQSWINKRRADARFGFSALDVKEVDELIRLLRKVRLSLGDLWQRERN